MRSRSLISIVGRRQETADMMMDTEYRIQMMEKMQKKISRSTDNALRTSLLGENMNDSRSLKVVNQALASKAFIHFLGDDCILVNVRGAKFMDMFDIKDTKRRPPLYLRYGDHERKSSSPLCWCRPWSSGRSTP